MSTEGGPASGQARNARTPIVLDGEWNMGIPLKVPMAVTGGGLLCTRGQIDVDAETRVLNPGDPLAQTRACLCHIARVLEAAGIAPGAALQVNHYYRAGTADPAVLEAEIRARLGAAVPVAMIPVPHFYYPGIETETDIVALAAGTAETRRRAVDGGHLAMASGPRGTFFAGRIVGAERVAASDPLAEVAALLGRADLPGRLWLHLQAPDIGSYRGLRDRLTAERRGWHVEILPCLTPAVPDIALTLSGHACPGGLRRSDPEGGIAILHGAGLAFVDIALPAPDPADARAERRAVLAAQAGRVMTAIGAALAPHGLGFGDVLKATTCYVGDDSAEDLYANLRVRDGFYAIPGPASTGVPFLALDRGEARIAVSLMLAAGRGGQRTSRSDDASALGSRHPRGTWDPSF